MRITAEEAPESRWFDSYTSGHLEYMLDYITANTVSFKDAYFQKAVAYLEGDQLVECAAQLEALLTEVAAKPEIFLEATKKKYQKTTELFQYGATETGDPVSVGNFTYVYPAGAQIRDGWVYFFTVSEVIEILEKAEPALERGPTSGNVEFWEYASGVEQVAVFLKSQLALVNFAIESKSLVVFCAYGRGKGYDHI
jgi:hypothetical protein